MYTLSNSKLHLTICDWPSKNHHQEFSDWSCSLATIAANMSFTCLLNQLNHWNVKFASANSYHIAEKCGEKILRWIHFDMISAREKLDLLLAKSDGSIEILVKCCLFTKFIKHSSHQAFCCMVAIALGHSHFALTRIW